MENNNGSIKTTFDYFILTTLQEIDEDSLKEMNDY